MQIKKTFTDETFGTADPDATDATVESASVIKVMNFLFLFLHISYVALEVFILRKMQ